MDRNDKCWCGSGLKYKKCHMDFDDKIREYAMNGHIVPDRFNIKTPREIEAIKESAKVNTGVLDHLEGKILAGMSTEDINKLVHDYTVSHDAIPAPLIMRASQRAVAHLLIMRFAMVYHQKI